MTNMNIITEGNWEWQQNKYEDMDSLPHKYCLKLQEQNSNGWGVPKAYNH
jgi:hypothetical protein